jgi:hypothetical protein
MGGKFDPKWYPTKSFLVIKKIIFPRNCVELRKKNGKSTVKTIHFNNVRRFPGAKKKKSKRKIVKKKISISKRLKKKK